MSLSIMFFSCFLLVSVISVNMFELSFYNCFLAFLCFSGVVLSIKLTLLCPEETFLYPTLGYLYFCNV